MTVLDERAKPKKRETWIIWQSFFNRRKYQILINEGKKHFLLIHEVWTVRQRRVGARKRTLTVCVNSHVHYSHSEMRMLRPGKESSMLSRVLLFRAAGWQLARLRTLQSPFEVSALALWPIFNSYENPGKYLITVIAVCLRTRRKWEMLTVGFTKSGTPNTRSRHFPTIFHG